VFWAVYFVDYWENSEEIMKKIKLENVHLLMKKEKEVYSIEDDFTTTIYNNYYICKMIATKLDEFYSWKVSHPLTHFIQTRSSSDINAFYQCLSYIPALTRLILETDIFDDMLDEKNKYNKNHLSQYIIELKLNNYMDFEFQGDPYLSVSDPQGEEFISHNQDSSNKFAS